MIPSNYDRRERAPIKVYVSADAGRSLKQSFTYNNSIFDLKALGN